MLKSLVFWKEPISNGIHAECKPTTAWTALWAEADTFARSCITLEVFKRQRFAP